MSKKTRLLAMLLVVCLCFGLLAGCVDSGAEGSGGPSGSSNPANSGDPGPEDTYVPLTGESGKYTYRLYSTSLSPNWNPHDYEDSGSSDVLEFLVDGFYQFAFNDELHPHKDPSRDGYSAYVIIPSMASGDPVDVTLEVKAAHPEWIPEEATSGYAWAIPMREDLYFDTGYHITAETFVEGAKRLLDPKLQNFRSTDVYSGATGIVGAETYFKQGAYGLGEFVSEDYLDEEYVDPADFTLSADGTYQVDGKDVVLDLTSGGNWGSNGLNRYYAAYAESMPNFAAEVDALKAAANDKGWVYLTPALLKNLQNAIAILQGYNNVEEYAADKGDYAYIEFEEMAFFGQIYPEVSFDTVGIYAKDKYTLVQVFKSSVAGFSLYYGGIQDSLLLVEPDVYDKCLFQDEAGNWYSTYMTSAETSPSYGPYSMTTYQTDKMVHYSKNDKWYGWNDQVNQVYKDPVDGQTYHTYMTTDIDWQVLDAVATAKNMFLSGLLTTYGMQVDDYDEYGFSDYLYASPAATVYFMLLTGNIDGLREREAAADFDQSKNDLETITLESFRKAFAISFDKQGYVDETSPSLTTAFGIYGTTQIYDPETSGFYRETPQAKQALVDFYSIDLADYNGNVDAALAALTGYDPETAKELYKQAFAEALELGYITSADGKTSDQSIDIKWPVVDNLTEVQQRRVNWLDAAFKKAVEGTPFEGKVSLTVTSKIYSDDNWSDALKAGEYDLMLCGWTGSLMNPYNLLTAYTYDNYAYAANWYNPKEDMLTLTVDGETVTMSVYNWAEAVNGTMVRDTDGNVRSYGENDTTQETRVAILAGCEGKLLQTYTYIPFVNNGSKFLLSQQVYYVVEEYNPVLGRGGVMYMKYNYDDAEWADFVNAQVSEHGRLQY